MAVDRPHSQRVIFEGHKQRFQLFWRRGLLTQPLCPILLGQDDRHPIVERADQGVGRTGYDRAALDALARLLIPPSSQSPAMTMWFWSAIATAYGCFSGFFHS
jgi:hypothetical protein